MSRFVAPTAAASIAALIVVSALPAFSAAVFAQANERIAYISAYDEKTRAPITGLGVGDFVIREDEAAREILRVTPATTPMAVTVLVDNTQAATPNIADIRRALASFVKAMQGVGPVSIIGVADRPTVLRDYTTDQQQLQDGVGKVFAMPGAGATLLDAIIEISRGIQKREEDRAAMVILTTENTEFSTRHYNEVLEALERGGAQLHAVILNTPAGTRLDDPSRNRASVLDLGPKQSGGTRSDVLTSQAFEGEMLKVAALLKNQHRVVYARPQTLIPPEKFEVTATKPGVLASGGPARGQKTR
jgi:hypothetical protein